jgi:tRNA 2-selenouridine synthase
MSVTSLSIQQFLDDSKGFTVLDVRSPGEYSHAHIPGAYSLPLFSDEERKIVGTAYKQQSREQAIKHGLDFFGSRMRRMIDEVESLTKSKGKSKKQKVFVHCWRGGMRSGAVSWLLDLYGFEVYLLGGGYKAYRNWVLQQFEKEYELKIVGGYTGSGKTQIIHQLKESGQSVIDLEGLANHKGSAFGGIGQPLQPRQEMFENMLASDLAAKYSDIIWLEDESQRIGSLTIPPALWKTMRSQPVYFYTF